MLNVYTSVSSPPPPPPPPPSPRQLPCIISGQALALQVLLVLTDQQLFSILIEEYVLECLLYVDTLVQVLQEPVQVNHILVDALKRLVEPGQYLEVVLTKLLITILQLLFNSSRFVLLDQVTIIKWTILNYYF